jgi:hypothetical protein
MNIIVRNMIQSDIEDLSRAFAAQGWLMPSSVFEHHYRKMLCRTSDMLVAEAMGEPAGFVRIEWLDAGGEYGYALSPEIKEFIVLEKFTGAGVAEAMIAEAERRVEQKTGEASGNALMAVYCVPHSRLPFRCSYVLDGLLMGHDGRFIRAKDQSRESGSAVISMCRARK